MAKKTKKIKKKDILEPTGNNKWSVASAAHEDEIKELLEEDWEPFSVDQGKIWFKKKKG